MSALDVFDDDNPELLLTYSRKWYSFSFSRLKGYEGNMRRNMSFDFLRVLERGVLRSIKDFNQCEYLLLNYEGHPFSACAKFSENLTPLPLVRRK